MSFDFSLCAIDCHKNIATISYFLLLIIYYGKIHKTCLWSLKFSNRKDEEVFPDQNLALDVHINDKRYSSRSD